jgi:conjugal transfer/entry exclusion protein
MLQSAHDDAIRRRATGLLRNAPGGRRHSSRQLEQRLDDLNKRMDDLKTSLNTRIGDLDTSLNKRVSDLATQMTTGFADVKASLAKLDMRVSDLEKGLRIVP